MSGQSLGWVASFVLFLTTFPASGQAGSIVIGFAGGFVAHDNTAHGEVQLAARLRDHSSADIQVRMYENHRGAQAHEEILHLLDRDHDGKLSAAEKNAARIVIYGHSWGASEAVNLARQLGHEHIPVVLTVQVDSVQKPGQDDGSIPSNVREAVNFYQSEGLLHGRARIFAADSSHTQILGNYQFTYKDKPVNCDGYSWLARMLMRPHIEIEADPAVWGQVESLIRGKLASSPADR